MNKSITSQMLFAKYGLAFNKHSLCVLTTVVVNSSSPIEKLSMAFEVFVQSPLTYSLSLVYFEPCGWHQSSYILA